jgi:hypothetical protein
MIKQLLFSTFLLFVLSGFSQNYILEQYRLSDGKTKRIKVGDKIILSFDQKTADYTNRPEAVFASKPDTGISQVFVKASITGITSSTIQFKDRSIGGNREIKLEQVTGIRKLTFGKQVLRTVSLGLSMLSVGLAIRATQNSDIFTVIAYAATAGIGLEYAENRFSDTYVKKWKIRVVQE